MTRTERDEPVTPAATRWARIFLILAAILGFWSILAALTGGIRYDIGPLRLSSRTPVRPALVAVLFAVIAWRLAYEGWLELPQGPGLGFEINEEFLASNAMPR